MPRSPCLLIWWGCSLIVLLAASDGCKTSDGYAVTGMVTYDGAPVPMGQINFSPNRQQGNQGRQVMALIEKGEIVPGERFASGGAYRVGIRCYDGVPYESGAEIISTGKPLCPPVAVEIDLPQASAELAIEIHKLANNKMDVKVEVQ